MSQVGDFVAQIRGSGAGRVGIIDAIEPGEYGKPSYWWVRFGPGGPTKRFRCTSFRDATVEEEAKRTGTTIEDVKMRRAERNR